MLLEIRTIVTEFVRSLGWPRKTQRHQFQRLIRLPDVGLGAARDEAISMIRFRGWTCTRFMAVAQTLDWRRVGIFTPLAAAIAVSFVCGRDLTRKPLMVVAVLLFAAFSLMFQVVPMMEARLPVGTRRAALLASLAGVTIYIWFAGTRFFHQASPSSLFLLIFIPIEIALILIVR